MTKNKIMSFVGPGHRHPKMDLQRHLCTSFQRGLMELCYKSNSKSSVLNWRCKFDLNLSFPGLLLWQTPSRVLVGSPQTRWVNKSLMMLYCKMNNNDNWLKEDVKWHFPGGSDQIAFMFGLLYNNMWVTLNWEAFHFSSKANQNLRL